MTSHASATERKRGERILERLIDGARLRQRLDVVVATGAITVILGLVWATVYATNGSSNVFLHAMYVPIIAASLMLGVTGGVATAVAAAILVGPLMPLNVDLGLPQPVQNTIYRAIFFVLVALTTSGFASITRRRHHQVLESRAKIGDLLARNLRLFARLVAERDEQTGGHCDRVASNAVQPRTRHPRRGPAHSLLGRHAPRPRQARCSGGHPPQARSPLERGVRGHQAASCSWRGAPRADLGGLRRHRGGRAVAP